MKKMKILAFGEVLWDFIDGEKHFGGAPVNFAAHVVKCGGESGIVTAVGRDILGDQAIIKIKELGISGNFVQQVTNQMTGRVTVSLNDGQPTYQIIEEVAYDYIDPYSLPINEVGKFDAFYFGTLIQRSNQSRQSLYRILDESNYSEIFLDLNLRQNCYSQETILKSLMYCTILKMNEEEAAVLSTLLYNKYFELSELIDQLRRDNGQIQLVIVTKGAKGCLVYLRDQCLSIPTQPIKVKDSVGAGDAFCAGFLTTFLQTRDAIKAAKIGNLIGGYVASQSGAVPNYTRKLVNDIEKLRSAES